MLNYRWVLTAVTAITPVVWGTTYFVTTEFLPPDRPLWAALLRALPAGLLLLAIARRLPTGSWWWKSAVLGVLNIGAFFALLFVAAYRLPGGVAATVGAVQPLLVVGLAAWLVGERATRRGLLAAVAGALGVAILVLRGNAALDPWGVAAALGGAGAMGLGVVLTRRWGSPATAIARTSWQLIAGSLLLIPLALIFEGAPPWPLTARQLGGYLYSTLIGTALAYTVWFRGLSRLPAGQASMLTLLSPVIATVMGWALLKEALTPTQILGALIVLVALAVAQHPGRPSPTSIAYP